MNKLIMMKTLLKEILVDMSIPESEFFNFLFFITNKEVDEIDFEKYIEDSYKELLSYYKRNKMSIPDWVNAYVGAENKKLGAEEAIEDYLSTFIVLYEDKSREEKT